VKGNPALEKDYHEKKEKVAKDAFLAVRARTGTDFATYFVSTLCSVPQRVGEARYQILARALLEKPETARTITLLALSARA
jgi:CRISPR-associated protein Cmx8